MRSRARFLLILALATGIVFATPSLAFEPKMIVIKKFSFHPRAYARTLVSSKEFACLDRLVKLESHWNNWARNPSSGAFGIFQFMPQTWTNYGYKKTSNSRKQIKYGLHYIKVRYGNACQALTFHLRAGWY